ncbi:MAG: hypothetical protein AB7F31_02095 [Parachlamydiales bacterium]
MKNFALLAALLFATAAYAAPEQFTFNGDVKIAGKHLTKRGEEKADAGNPSRLAWQNEDKANFEATFNAYVKDQGNWASAKVKVANKIGTVKASEAITLEQALVGKDFYENGATRWYGELGRQPLCDHFESAVQFNHDFDGFYSEYSRPVGRYGTFVAQGGPMVVDLDHQRFGGIAMTGLDGIWGTGAYTRVSMTYWDSHKQPIQLLAGYRFPGFWLVPKGRTYAAYLINPAASSHRSAGYIGVQVGNVQKQGNWSAKVELRAVEANALYKDDATGTNFWGPLSEVGYAFTDNFSAKLKLQHSERLSHHFKGDHSSSAIEGKLILSF